MTCKSWEKEEKGWNCFVLCLFLSIQCASKEAELGVVRLGGSSTCRARKIPGTVAACCSLVLLTETGWGRRFPAHFFCSLLRAQHRKEQLAGCVGPCPPGGEKGPAHPTAIPLPACPTGG